MRDGYPAQQDNFIDDLGNGLGTELGRLDCTRGNHTVAARQLRQEERSSTLRHWVIVLGDQLDVLSDLLDADLSPLDGFDTERDAAWMAENRTEATHAWSHKRRFTLFSTAMRHHRDALRAQAHELPLDVQPNTGTFTKGCA